MLQSEKRSLFRFLTIYFVSTFSLFLLATFIFYDFQKHHILDTQKKELFSEANAISKYLRQLNETFSKPLVYPHKNSINSAIFNIDKAYIFGTFTPKDIEWNKEYYEQGNLLFHIHALYPYYLGASYIIISKPFDVKPIEKLLKVSLLFLMIAGILFSFLGLFLGKLFIAPMKESIQNINSFIEDTTHELNTPISTILTNIELLDTLYECEGKQEMRRIEIASKTLSRLYEDLTYLKLNHNYHREIKLLNFSELLYERIEFFSTLIEAKYLLLKLDIDLNVILKIDKNDAIRMLDNLISNAIKYNKKGADLKITLKMNSLLIEDFGLGIEEENIQLIQQRFKRANQSEGGFGIGLDIVGQVVARYKFEFKITSIFNQGTKVTILW